eukprot:6364752-Karenia_brevis.AAC.1
MGSNIIAEVLYRQPTPYRDLKADCQGKTELELCRLVKPSAPIHRCDVVFQKVICRQEACVQASDGQALS